MVEFVVACDRCKTVDTISFLLRKHPMEEEESKQNSRQHSE